MKPIMENFRATVRESRNTHGADINEILFAYIAAGNTFGDGFVNGEEAEAVLREKTSKVKDSEYEDQYQRAVHSFEQTIDWAVENGFLDVAQEERIAKVWWTARPNVLAKAVRVKLDDGTFQEASPGNPTDVLLQFDNGKFLGVSLKSMKPPKGDIGFKNPGVGAIGTSLGIKLIAALNNMDKIALDQLGVPQMTQDKRKKWLRQKANSAIRAETEKVGKLMLSTLRDVLLAHMESMSTDEVRKHILSHWMDAGDLYPYYIKVTGRGTAAKGYNASAEDPSNNDQFRALIAADSFKFHKTGKGKDWEATIGVEAVTNDKPTRILKMRFKFESEKLASSLKMSGDPYK